MQSYEVRSELSFGRKLRNLPLIYRLRSFFKIIYPWLETVTTVSRIYGHLLLKRTQFYQPLYNFSIIKKVPERTCIERADAIYHSLKDRDHGARILDLGCNFGYFSFYFAERGYTAEAIDTSAHNIALCKLLQRVNQKNTSFSVAEFSKEYLEKMPAKRYDISFLFSVLHHIAYLKGFEYTQDLMALLTEKIPVLFIELATKAESETAPWREFLTDNDLDIFAKCSNINIEKIGDFSIHGRSVLRPLYKVTKLS